MKAEGKSHHVILCSLLSKMHFVRILLETKS